MTSNLMTSMLNPAIATILPVEVVPSPQLMEADKPLPGAMKLNDPTGVVKLVPANSWIVTPPLELTGSVTIALLWMLPRRM